MPAVLERLAQYVECVAPEVRKLIEKQNAVVCQGYLAG